ncbi:hypothetical protein SAMN06264364_101183 [Quadrisphaera granulorum]|uniref:Uncharacterized protein n=1 Tax=Quadrisphaera granulorum TaxID=317664 RepID=A0A316AG23_9ACTN|nr:hypothetical protein [Quadrisphaera granulorum]PWJ56208.1 hypothetical protein BXY45_101183 [Quadrisphaera granulorum]SZE94842.1 hypothetical protein SAMN06264364_101183 [Quadrisphaera granulorum]
MTIGQTTDRPAARDDADGSPSRVDEVVRVALTVPGVTGVRIEPDTDGSALLRLELAPGADEQQVAAAVQAALAREAAVGPVASDTASDAASAGAPGVEPGPGPVALVAPVAAAAGTPSPSSSPAAEAPRAAARVPMPALTPERPERADRPRTGRISVPPLSASSVAATPAPQWLNDSAPEPKGEGSERLVLERVQVVTEGLSTTATVVLVRGRAVHTGVAESANTPAGGPRALASATLRALESAAGGSLRAEIEAVRPCELDGRAAVTVMIGTASSRGSEQLVGSALEGGTQPAVVRAVLAACNRRLAPELR